MTKAEKRVAIARDVLKRLRYLHLKEDNYITEITSVELKVPPTANAQEVLPVVEKKCEVCALGGMLLSYCRLYDKMTVEDLLPETDNENESDEMRYAGSFAVNDHLGKIFSLAEMARIETAFEGTRENGWRMYAPIEQNYYHGDHPPTMSAEQRDAANDFHDKYPEPSERLRAIMQNIVKNGGTFVLPIVAVSRA